MVAVPAMVATGGSSFVAPIGTAGDECGALHGEPGEASAVEGDAQDAEGMRSADRDQVPDMAARGPEGGDRKWGFEISTNG